MLENEIICKLLFYLQKNRMVKYKIYCLFIKQNHIKIIYFKIKHNYFN